MLLDLTFPKKYNSGIKLKMFADVKYICVYLFVTKCTAWMHHMASYE